MVPSLAILCPLVSHQSNPPCPWCGRRAGLATAPWTFTWVQLGTVDYALCLARAPISLPPSYLTWCMMCVCVTLCNLLNSLFKCIFLHFRTNVCSTIYMWHEVVVLHKGSKLATKSIMAIELLLVIYFFIRVEIDLLNKVNLTGCFIFTFKTFKT